MRITSKGQVTIPGEIRERAGLLPHTEVEFVFDRKVVRITRAKTGKKAGRGARLVTHLRGRGDVAMSTAEIMALTRAGSTGRHKPSSMRPTDIVSSSTRSFTPRSLSGIRGWMCYWRCQESPRGCPIPKLNCG